MPRSDVNDCLHGKACHLIEIVFLYELADGARRDTSTNDYNSFHLY